MGHISPVSPRTGRDWAGQWPDPVPHALLRSADLPEISCRHRLSVLVSAFTRKTLTGMDRLLLASQCLARSSDRFFIAL